MKRNTLNNSALKIGKIVQKIIGCILFNKIWTSNYVLYTYVLQIAFIGSVALLWRNAKCDINPGLSYFKRCSLACTHLLANLHLCLHFTFCQSKAMLPLWLPKFVHFSDIRAQCSKSKLFLEKHPVHYSKTWHQFRHLI